MSIYLFPRWFDDTAVPILDGEPLLLAEGNLEYRYYLSWLADYLPTIVPRGTGIVDMDFEWRRGEAAGIGYDAFDHLEYCFWGFEKFLEAGADYEETYQEMKEWHRELWAAQDADWKKIFPINYLINPEIWSNAVREYEALLEIPDSHLDIGYRHLLAPLIAGVKSRQERYAILHSFYCAFDEDASK